MKGVWIDADVLALRNITALAKIIYGMVRSLASRGYALTIPTEELASRLGVTVATVRAALYELRCANLIASNDIGITIATLAGGDDNVEVRRYRVPDGVVVVAEGTRASLLQPAEGGPCIQVDGLPARDGDKVDDELSDKVAAMCKSVWVI